MQKHTEIYFKESGLDPHDFTPCETCGAQAVDTAHIEARGMGGNPSKDKDTFINLMASCRECHNFYGDKKLYKNFLKKRHAANFPQLLEWSEEKEQIIRLS